MTRWEARGRDDPGRDDPVPKVMGIVNLTPDSFSDGGRLVDPEAAIWRMRSGSSAEGADLLDLGGESSRPGAEPVSLERRAAPGHSRRRGAGGSS